MWFWHVSELIELVSGMPAPKSDHGLSTVYLEIIYIFNFTYAVRCFRVLLRCLRVPRHTRTPGWRPLGYSADYEHHCAVFPSTYMVPFKTEYFPEHPISEHVPCMHCMEGAPVTAAEDGGWRMWRSCLLLYHRRLPASYHTYGYDNFCTNIPYLCVGALAL
jgi:hypothetical protein